MGPRDRLAKQNEIGRRRLTRELVKLEQAEKSGLRMIETERQRFRSRRRKTEDLGESSGANAVSVRMYETHNPGFCYHCTGAIKESGTPGKERQRGDSYGLVRSILFADGELDPDKLLCLHLLAAHAVKWNAEDDFTVRPVTPLLEKARKKQFTGAWNSVLPCYVFTVQESPGASSRVDVKLHEDPRQVDLEDAAVRELEQRYKQYLEANAEFEQAVSATAKKTGMAPKAVGKMPIVSPHVYSLLIGSREARRNRLMLETGSKRKFLRSSGDLSTLDEASLSFRLDEDEDTFSKATNNVSTSRNWGTRSMRSSSRKSAFGSGLKLDGLTMFRARRGKPADYTTFRQRNQVAGPKELLTIKSSSRMTKDAPSRSSSARSTYRNVAENPSSTNSLISSGFNSESMIRSYGRCVYLNSPVKSVELRSKSCKTVPILVNYQTEALVQAVLEVLGRANPGKLRRIVETARDPEEIRKMLSRQDTQLFLQSLLGRSLISSPESFVVSVATAVTEIDFRFEGILEKEIIALTLEAPPVPALHAVLAEIQDKIFRDSRKRIGSLQKCCASDKEKCAAAPSSGFGPNTDSGSIRGSDDRKSLRAPSKIIRSSGGEESPGKRVEPEEDFLERAPEPESSCDPRGICIPTFARPPINENKEQSAVRLSDKKQAAETKSRRYGKNRSDEQERSPERCSDERQIQGNKSLKQSSYRRIVRDGQFDVDHAILRRMTNAQRIIVGQMCASLKAKRINNEGLINERLPLAALIAPALSRESIKALTRGTIYSKAEPANKQRTETEVIVSLPDEITGSLLAKIQQDVAESETKRRLSSFLEKKT